MVGNVNKKTDDGAYIKCNKCPYSLHPPYKYRVLCVSMCVFYFLICFTFIDGLCCAHVKTEQENKLYVTEEKCSTLAVILVYVLKWVQMTSPVAFILNRIFIFW